MITRNVNDAAVSFFHQEKLMKHYDLVDMSFERWTPLTRCWTNKDTIFTHSLFEDMQGKSTGQALPYSVDTLSLEILYLDLNAAYHINLGVWSWVSIYFWSIRPEAPRPPKSGMRKWRRSWKEWKLTSLSTCGTTSQKRTLTLWKSTQAL